MSVPLHIASYWLRPRIQHLILHVTDRCNLRCKHCFVNLTEKNTIRPTDTRRIADALGSILWLDIGGGEPFLLDELPELIAPIDCEVLGISTNGHDAEKIAAAATAILQTARARDVVVSVSIEGFREDHTEIRGNKNNYDAAFDTLRSLRDVAERDPRLRVKCNTVVTNRNADGLIDFMAFMQQGGLIDFHSIILMRGGAYDTHTQLPPMEKLKALRPEIFRILDQYMWGCGRFKRAFLRKYYRFLWDVSFGNLETGGQVIPCTGGQTHLVVWANGDVSACELLPPFGNIHEQSLPDILSGQDRKDRVKMIKRKECSCTHNCVMLDSILFNPKSYTKLLSPV